MMDRRAPLVFIVAGEISGDALAAGLLRQLRVRYPQARFVGVAGPRMIEAGCEPLESIEALSLFGVAEVMAHVPRLLRLRQRLYEEALRQQPDVFIGVDAPAFNTRLEQRLRSAGIATVHYVCPTVWAWRAGRIPAIRRAVDLMLAIFPFEPDFFAVHDIPVTFVGHPLAEVLSVVTDQAGLRARLGMTGARRWVGLLPGSRGSEVSRLGPRFLSAARWLKQRYPEVRFVVPMASARVRAIFESDLSGFDDLDVLLVDEQAREVMQAVDVLLVASGTATLEATLAGTPMVVAYELSRSNYWLARCFNLLRTEFVSMPNLLAGRRIVPELLQTDSRPEMLGAWLYRLLHSPTACAEQCRAFADIHATLALGADARAAEAVANVLEAQS